MLKREQTCGGGGVTLVEAGRVLSTAFRTADRRARTKRLARRLVGLATSGDPPLTLQSHVPGQLALRTVACREGRILAGITFAAEQLDPPVTGSSTVLRRIDHPEIDEAVRLITQALGCSGFISFDFIVSPDGSAYLIELNARPVGSGHLGVRFGRDVYGGWLTQFAGFRIKTPEVPVLEPARSVALFPKEMQRDPASACLSRVRRISTTFRGTSRAWSRPIATAWCSAIGSGGSNRSKATAVLRSRRTFDAGAGEAVRWGGPGRIPESAPNEEGALSKIAYRPVTDFVPRQGIGVADLADMPSLGQGGHPDHAFDRMGVASVLPERFGLETLEIDVRDEAGQESATYPKHRSGEKAEVLIRHTLARDALHQGRDGVAVAPPVERV